MIGSAISFGSDRVASERSSPFAEIAPPASLLTSLRLGTGPQARLGPQATSPGETGAAVVTSAFVATDISSDSNMFNCKDYRLLGGRV
jgi:hypothetical protein